MSCWDICDASLLPVIWRASLPSPDNDQLHDMTLLCQVQAPGHAAEGEHLKLFKDADADIGNLLAAAPPQGPTVPRGHDHTNSGPIAVHPFGLQPWSMAGPGPSFPHASTAALHTSMMSDEARLGSSSLFMPSNHLIVPNSLPAQNAVDVAGPEGGQGTASQPQSRRSTTRIFLCTSSAAYTANAISQTLLDIIA